MRFLTNSKMLVLITAVSALLGVTSCSSVEPPPASEGVSTVAYQEGVPGGVIVNTIDVNARVTHINTSNREVRLLDSDGETFKVEVRPDVDLDQIEVGDRVKATVAEQLVIYLASSNDSLVSGSAAIVGVSDQAGGIAAETHVFIGTVTVIDREKRKVTLRFQDGSTKTVPVRSDIDLSKHQAGDQVVFHLTEMIAVGIEKP